MPRPKKSVARDEKHALETACSIVATVLSRCVMGKPDVNFPRTLIVDWASLETLYAQSEYPLPKLMDCFKNKPIVKQKATEVPVCTRAAARKDFESVFTNADMPEELIPAMRDFDQIEREKTDNWNAKLDQPEPGQVRVTIDEVLSPAVELLAPICKELFVGFSFPVISLRTEGQIYHLINNYRIDRVKWPTDVVLELKRHLLKIEVKVDPSKPIMLDQPPTYEIIQTRRGKYFAKLRTGQYKRFEPTDNEKVFLVSMFNKWKELSDASTLFDLTRTVSDGTSANVQGKSDMPTDVVSLSYKSLVREFGLAEDTVRTYIDRFNQSWATLTEDNGKVLIRKGDLVVVTLDLDVREIEKLN